MAGQKLGRGRGGDGRRIRFLRELLGDFQAPGVGNAEKEDEGSCTHVDLSRRLA